MRASNVNRLGRFAAAMLALALSAPLAAAEADSLLARMADTMRTLDYQGTLVYQQGDRIDAMSLVHGWVAGQEHERLRTLTGEPFELIRVGTAVTCVWPRDQRALVSQRPGQIAPLRSLDALAELPDVYSAALGGEDRVAGRGARIVDIRAADAFRYGYRMWIDPRTGLLLRSDLLAGDGTPLERILFTQIQPLEQVSADAFEPSLDPDTYTRHVGPAGTGESLEQPEWVARDLPRGFRAISHVRRPMPPDSGPVQQSVYSDGLASVSVFVEPQGSEPVAMEGMSRMGAVHVFGRVVEGHQITAMGEVPGATVRAVAEAVTRRSAD